MSSTSRLTISTGPPRLAVVLLGAALGMGLLGVTELGVAGSSPVERGAVATAVTLLLVGAGLTAEWSVFRFDAVTRRFHWSTGRVLRRDRGSVPFREITGVLREALLETDHDLHRLVVRTRHRGVALTRSFSGGGEDLDRAVEIVRAFLLEATEPGTSTPDEPG